MNRTSHDIVTMSFAQVQHQRHVCLNRPSDSSQRRSGHGLIAII